MRLCSYFCKLREFLGLKFFWFCCFIGNFAYVLNGNQFRWLEHQVSDRNADGSRFNIVLSILPLCSKKFWKWCLLTCQTKIVVCSKQRWHKSVFSTISKVNRNRLFLKRNLVFQLNIVRSLNLLVHQFKLRRDIKCRLIIFCKSKRFSNFNVIPNFQFLKLLRCCEFPVRCRQMYIWQYFEKFLSYLQIFL